MKKILSILMVVGCIASLSICSATPTANISQATSKTLSVKKGEKVTVTYDVAMRCESCEKKILETLPFCKGVKEVQINFEESKVSITYDSSKTNDEKIIEEFRKIDLEARVGDGEGEGSGCCNSCS